MSFHRIENSNQHQCSNWSTQISNINQHLLSVQKETQKQFSYKS